jgi:hypothetical protein
MSEISISFGALAPHVGEQEPRMRAGVSINLLRISGILTRGEATKAEQRMFKLIVKDLERNDD